MKRPGLPFLILCFAVWPQAVAAEGPTPYIVHGTVVDKEGNPVAGAVVQATVIRGSGVAEESSAVTADAEGAYRFPKPFNTLGQYLNLTAADASGLQLGWLNAGRTELIESETSFQIVVKPAREVTVKVTDAAGAPVNNATVGLLIGAFARVPGSIVNQGRTGTDGLVTLRYPVDAGAGSVFALKSGTGLSTWRSAMVDGYPTDQPEIPRELSMTLDGAMTVRVRVVDEAGQPVSGVSVALQQFSRRLPPADGQPQLSFFLGNAGAVPTVSVATDQQGIAAFDWVPAEFKGMLQFDIKSETHFTSQPLSLTGDTDPIDRAPVPLEVVRFTKISGTIVGSDGKSAAGIGVTAQRSGGRRVMNGHIAATRTGADGTYELNACPQCTYIVQVVDRDWAASSVGVTVGNAQPVGGVDFSLAKGTIIRGTVTTGKNRHPAVDVSVSLKKSGNLFPRKLPKPGEREDPTDDPRRSATRGTFTDAQGRYEFRVVSGNYTLTVVDNPATVSTKTSELDIADEPEFVRDFHIQGAQLGELSGVVVGPDKKPVGSPVIRALYAGFVRPYPNREIKVSVDVSGTFHLERQPVAVWLFASSHDGTLASRVQVEADQESVTVELASAATLVGRLIDDDRPLAGAEIMLRQQLISPGPGGRSRLRFFTTGTFTTDADGRFAIPGLIVGEKYNGIVTLGADGGRIALDPSMADRGPPSIVVDTAGTIDLGNIEVPKWRIQTTPDNRGERRVDIPARAAGRFNDKAALSERISLASADAKREYRRVMLVVGDPELPATQALFKIPDRIEIDPDLARTVLEFQPVYVSVKDQAAVAYLAKTYQIKSPERESAALAILGDDGALAEQHVFQLVGDPPALDAPAVHVYLKRHALPARDANQFLQAALRRARDEKKRVLVQQSGSSVYACRLLARFIDQHRDLLERDFVYVHVDAVRSRGADVVFEKLRKTGNAVPWMAILSADGVKLADSESPTGNIGFPSEADRINFFIDKMLKPTAQRLTAQELEELRTALQRK